MAQISVKSRVTIGELSRPQTIYGELLNKQFHLRLPIHIFCYLNIAYPLPPSTDLRIEDILTVLGDELEWDADLVWKVFRGSRAFTCSTPLEKELRRRFPLDTLDFPTFKMADRLRELEDWLGNNFSPEYVANYLGIVSFEVAYPLSEDDSKKDLFRAALSHWAACSADPSAKSESEGWENTIRRLFALGANFRLLCGGRGKEETAKAIKQGVRRDEIVVEVIHHFVVPYALARAWVMKVRVPEFHHTREVVNGFECFISKTEHLDISLGPSSSCRRFDLRIDERFVYSDFNCDADDRWWEPHDCSLYFDDGLSTWVMWDSAYEVYCGEFWDLIDHPEKTMLGTWIE